MNNNIKSFALSAILLNLGILLGRLSGFVREIIIANNYGASYQADLTIVLMTLPDILVNLLVGGALSAALIPSMVNAPKLAKRLLFQVSFFLLFIFSIVSGFFYVYSEWLVSLFAPGFSGNLRSSAHDGIKYVVLVIPLFVITGVLTAYLQSKEKFTVPSLGTLCFNSVIILFLIVMVNANAYSVEMIAFAVLCAGFARYFSQLLAVYCLDDSAKFVGPWIIDKSLIKRYLQAMVSGSLIFVFPVIARSFSTFLGEGSLSTFSYAMRLVEFPLLASVTFITILFLPKLAKSFENNIDEFKGQLLYACQCVFVLGLVSSSMLIASTDTYVELVYGSFFDELKLDEIKRLVRIGLVGLLFQGFIILFISVFNATKNTSVPVKVNSISALTLFSILWLLKDEITIQSIMLSVVLIYFFMFLCYFYFLRGWLFGVKREYAYSKYYAMLVVFNTISGFFLYKINANLDGEILRLICIVIVGLLTLSVSIVLHPFIFNRMKKRLQSYV